METISKGLGFEKTILLIEANPAIVPPPKTVKQTPDIERIDPAELEYAYVKHPIVFNAINKLTQCIMSAGWELRATNPKVLDYFKKFIEEIGQTGEDITFDEILESIFQYQMIYGSAYLETVIGKHTNDPNNIVDLVILDPKRMDYAKLSDLQIALNSYGKPVGYTQNWPTEVSTEGKGDKVPEGSDISLGMNQIFLSPYRITHFKYYEYGDRFYPMGIVEAAYQSILYEMMIKRKHSNAMDKRGDDQLVDYVGDSFHEPTPQQIQNALNNVKQLSSSNSMALPYWHRLDTIKTKPNTVVDDTLNYLRQDICSSLGIPLSLATGSGEATNRATLATQLLFLTFTLNNFVQTTLSTLQKNIFARICEYNKFTEVPQIVWGHIGVEEINDKAKRITEYIKSGALIPTDESVSKFIKKSEKLE